MDGQYWRPNHVNKRVVADIWLLTVSWTLTWEMMRIRNFYCFVYRQHMWLRKWEVIVGDMIDHVGIYGSRMAEGLSAFNVGLVDTRISCTCKTVPVCWNVSIFLLSFRLYARTHTAWSSLLCRVESVKPGGVGAWPTPDPVFPSVPHVRQPRSGWGELESCRNGC